LKSEKTTQEAKGLSMAGRTIRDAVCHGLPKKRAELIIRMFNATKVMDVYDGDLDLYFEVIAQTLEKQNEKLYTMKQASHTIRSIVEANF